MRKDRIISWLLLLLALCLRTQAGDEAQNMLQGGDFQSFVPGDKLPPELKAWGNFSFVKDGDKVWLKLEGKGGMGWVVALPEDLATLKFSARLKATDVVAGEQGWQDGRIALEFVDAQGKHVGNWPKVLSAKGSTDWIDFSEEYRIPPGAVSFKVSPSNFGQSGTVEFDEIILLPGKRREPLSDLSVPEGFAPDPQLARAFGESSQTQARLCLNSLWQFLPVAEATADIPPAGAGWGWFKVPGIWPTKESYGVPPVEQNVRIPAALEEVLDLYDLTTAWYKRSIIIPADWQGRRIGLEFTMLQSYAKVFLDGKPCGELLFPGGTLDLSAHATPGVAQELTILVRALPLAKDRTVFMAPDRAFTEKGSLNLRGITGDLFLTSAAPADRIEDVRVETSVREKSVTFNVALTTAAADFTVEAEAVIDGEKTVFPAQKMNAAAVQDGRLRVRFPWENPLLWDIHTPQNQYQATITLRDASGKVLAQSLPVRFGFREFRIDGRDFYLNGKRIHLRALVLDNINYGAGQASYEASRRTLEKLKEYGFNFFITHNYDFAPGRVGYMDGLFRAADDLGVLAAFSMPHVKDFDWKLDQPEQEALYRQLSDWLASRACNHPSIVTYAMNHNACGYKGDQNPLRIDGVYNIDDPEHGGAPSRNRAQALQAAGIVKQIDPTRPVYHHQSGNLGDMYTINIYLNWSPVQERSDWLEHWQKNGVKPVFFVEWGLPHIASWSTYRGPHFIWRTPALQQIWDAEFAAAEKGATAYQTVPEVLRSLKQQQGLYEKDEPFTWSSIIAPLRSREHNYLEIQNRFLSDNWRSHRVRGISAALPWDQDGLWNRVPNSPNSELTNPAPFANLEQPGIVPDVSRPSWRYLYALPDTRYEATSLGRGFLRWNMPLCAFIAGRAGDFSEKRHNLLPGQRASKQLMLINDLREEVECSYEWTLENTALKGAGKIKAAPGATGTAELALALPEGLAPGAYILRAKFSFPAGAAQEDTFVLNVLPAPAAHKGTIALYDPLNLSGEAFAGHTVRRIERIDEVKPGEILVIGQSALRDNRPLTGISGLVRGGLRVLVLAQDERVLADRLGLRMNVHGLRKVFSADPAHAVFAGLADDNLRDWAGSSTLLPPYLEGAEQSDPSWFWNGFENTRVWRCGNRGNVASALPEKPERGNFNVLAKGGFDLQFAPLLEYREGEGLVMLCQVEVSGRTEEEPAARRLLDNILAYMKDASAAQMRKVYYAGGEEGARTLRELGVEFAPYTGAAPGGQDLLVVATGYKVAIDAPVLLKAGVNMLALGLDAQESARLAGAYLKFEQRTLLPSFIGSFDSPALRFLGNEDTYWRGELPFAAITSAGGIGNEALRAVSVDKGGTLVMSQAGPWLFADNNPQYFRKSQRRNWYLTGQLLRNLGARQDSPFLGSLEGGGRPSFVQLSPLWKGKADPDNTGRTNNWQALDFDTKDWKTLRVPGSFDQQFAELADYDGYFWYKLDFEVGEGIDGEGMRLFLGAIDDESWVWLNGKFLGEISKATNPKDHYIFPRDYALSAGDLLPGKTNNLTVLVNDTYLTGGIRGTPKLSAPGRWLQSYYVMPAEAGDDPYRYYRW